jgi:UDP-glucose 4-epimerase
MCRKITGHAIPTVMGERRPGDPPELIANAAKANSLLGWRPQHSDLENIVKTAWNWHQNNPTGYDKS